MIELSDAELISSFINGEEKAFNEIVRRYQKKIYYCIKRYVHEHDEADDILQNVFIKVYKNIKQFKGNSSFYTWIYRIATNESFTYIKIKKARNFIKIDENFEFKDEHENPEKEVEQNEMKVLIQKGIDLLPEKQKQVFVLRYYEEMPFKEIAQIMKTSEGGLKANYFHALKKISEFIKNEM